MRAAFLLGALSLGAAGCNQILGITDVTYRDGGIPVDANPDIPDANPEIPDAIPIDADPNAPDASPTCVITFDDQAQCDFAVEQCALTISAGACGTPTAGCAASGDALQVTEKTRFDSSVDIYSISLVFGADGAGSSGEIDFHDINGDPTGGQLSAEAECDVNGVTVQTMTFSPPMRWFHVYTVGGTVWIDDLTIN